MFLLGVGNEQTWLKPYPNANVIKDIKPSITLASYALTCFWLLFGMYGGLKNAQNDSIELYPTTIIFSTKRREKRYALPSANDASAVKVFLEKYYLKGGDFFKNPEGLTLTDGKRNGYLCILFFSYKELTSNLRGTQIKCVHALRFI